MRLEPPPRQRWSPRRLVGLAILPAAIACSSETEPPQEAPPATEQEPEQVSIAPAVYATELLFVGFAEEPLRLYTRFVNVTSEDVLERRYTGWMESGDGWRPLETLQDRLPVPRAAWRVLPGGPWRVLAADGGELAGVVYRDTLTEFRLTPRQLVAEWTGETGQREALLLARVQQGDSLRNGLLVLRRAARLKRDQPEQAAPTVGADSLPESVALGLRAQLFLLVDSLSNGLLVARDANDPDSTAIAWTWVGSIGNEWTDVRVQPPPEDATRALNRWQIELPEAGVTARFRLEALPEDSAAAAGSAARLPQPFALQGRLEILGSGQPAAGLGVESRS